MSEPLDREADRLYALPLDEFIAARDEWARALRAAGRRDDASAVRSLAKPSLSAWAINQLAVRHGPALQSFFELGEELRQRQRRALSSGRGGAELREAVARRRELVVDLVDAAAAELAATGRTVSPAVQAELVATLEAALVDDEVADAVRRGRLLRAPDAPSGFGALDQSLVLAPEAGRLADAGRRSPPSRTARAPGREAPAGREAAGGPEPEAERVIEPEAERVTARVPARAAGREAARRATAHRAAQAAVDGAETLLASRRRAAAEAEEAFQQAERTARELDREAEHAERTARETARAAERAATAARDARRRVAAAERVVDSARRRHDRATTEAERADHEAERARASLAALDGSG